MHKNLKQKNSIRGNFSTGKFSDLVYNTFHVLLMICLFKKECKQVYVEKVYIRTSTTMMLTAPITINPEKSLLWDLDPGPSSPSKTYAAQSMSSLLQEPVKSLDISRKTIKSLSSR